MVAQQLITITLLCSMAPQHYCVEHFGSFIPGADLVGYVPFSNGYGHPRIFSAKYGHNSITFPMRHTSPPNTFLVGRYSPIMPI